MAHDFLNNLLLHALADALAAEAVAKGMQTAFARTANDTTFPQVLFHERQNLPLQCQPDGILFRSASERPMKDILADKWQAGLGFFACSATAPVRRRKAKVHSQL